MCAGTLIESPNEEGRHRTISNLALSISSAMTKGYRSMAQGSSPSSTPSTALYATPNMYYRNLIADSLPISKYFSFPMTLFRAPMRTMNCLMRMLLQIFWKNIANLLVPCNLVLPSYRYGCSSPNQATYYYKVPEALCSEDALYK